MLPHKIILIPLLCLATLSASAEVSITAEFSPPRIMLGDKARYVVQIQETSTSQMPTMEEVKSLPIANTGGLQLSNGRTSNSNQQTSIFNGKAKFSISQQLIIDAKAASLGKFTIPTYTIQYEGETLPVPAATLEVLERSANSPLPTDELIFLKVDTPKQLYVGQTTNIKLKMYVSEQVRLRNLISFDRSTDGFTINDELPDRLESVEVFNQRRYTVLTWPFTITPIQTGKQDLNFQFTVGAQMPGQSNRRDQFGRGMGGSVFDDFFGRNERYTLYTEPTQVEILPLPTKDKPDSFTGGIGEFRIKAYTDRKSTGQGEPIMLSIEVAGKGNFDRINGPIIAKSNDWRNYSPESKFTPSSGTDNLRGTKRFDYVMIPEKAGTLELPQATFTYFDPVAKQYIDMKAPSIKVEVSPSNTPTAPAIQTPGNSPLNNEIVAQPLQQELSIEEAILTLDYRRDGVKASNSGPILESTWFWICNTLTPLTIIGACLLLRRNRRLAEDPAYAAQHATKQELAEAKKAAMIATDMESFYQQSQRAVRLAASVKAQKNLHTAGAAEVNQAAPNSAAEEIDELFKAADIHRFSKSESSGDLTNAKTSLGRILKAL